MSWHDAFVKRRAETYTCVSQPPRRARRSSGEARRRAIGVVSAIVAVAGPGAAAAGAAVTATTMYNSPGVDSFTVPQGVSSIEVTAVGAAGGGNANCTPAGGRGGSISGTIPVLAGQQLSIGVGAPGTVSCGGASPGTIGGGGAGGPSAGSGGGASVVSTPQPSPGYQSALIVAGGGGGATAGGAGGDAGAAGGNGPFTNGGGPGTANAGGGGGTDISGGNNGANGSFGVGGAGAAFFSIAGGGGGGGGYYGGGGGGASTLPPFGSGGGGGSSFITSQASNISGPTVTAAAPSVSITYAAPTADLGSTALTFGTEPQGSVSTEQMFTLTNNGSAPLVVSGVEPGGADPSDYLIIDGCQHPVAAGSGCQIGVRFSPQAQGASSASLTVLSNAVTAASPVALSGTGGPATQGAAGPQGPTGATGPRGPQGPAGAAGTIVCRNNSVALALCTLEFAPGTWSAQGKLTRAAFEIQQAGRTIAHGTLPIKQDRLTTKQIGKLRRGRYTLIITDGQQPHARVMLRLAFRVR